MCRSISKSVGAHEVEPVSLSELIHQHVRVAIETAVDEEMRAALGTSPYERSEVRRGYRNGTKARTLTGPTGPVALTLPRAALFAGAKEWASRIVPRYQRRMPQVNERSSRRTWPAATPAGFVAHCNHCSRRRRSRRARCRASSPR